MAHEPMTLDTEDPVEALRQIASYLRCVDMKSGRKIMTEDKSEILGYWQQTEYLQGLLEIADECDRIRQLVLP